MVEKMKKYSFLIYYKTYNEFLDSIRRAGVVHIVEKQKGVPEDATDLRQKLSENAALKETVLELQHTLKEDENVELRPFNPDINPLDIIADYEKLKTNEEQLNLTEINLHKEIQNMSYWGNFDLNTIHDFEKAGYNMNFYACHEREFNEEWSEKYNAMFISNRGSVVYFITLTPMGCHVEVDAETMYLSHRSLHELEADLLENKKQINELKDRRIEIAIEHLNNLKELSRQLIEGIDLEKVHLQAEKKVDEKLILLEGWIPEKNEPELIQALSNQDVCYIDSIPQDGDKTAPILLKNNRLAKLFEPIGEMYELPNYHELDLTPFFAPFFMLFFGLCLGDVGYGFLVLFATLYARTKVKPALKPIMTLASVLGGATVICGIISGTLFGIPLLDMDWAWLTSFKKIMIDSDNMFNVALILGAVQILFGMFVKACGAVRRYGWAYSLAHWGWVILFIGGGSMYLVSEKALLPPDMARYLVYTILGIAGLFIFVLNTPKRNPLINIGVGLWNTFNMATGLVGDLLSYIRLFALGLSGSVMGFVFNQLAIQISGDIPVVSQLVMIIILLFGHSINIFMSGLGAFVHPMRLTFVEFYKNSGFEGGGKKYRPFTYLKDLKI